MANRRRKRLKLKAWEIQYLLYGFLGIVAVLWFWLGSLEAAISTLIFVIMVGTIIFNYQEIRTALKEYLQNSEPLPLSLIVAFTILILTSLFIFWRFKIANINAPIHPDLIESDLQDWTAESNLTGYARYSQESQQLLSQREQNIRNKLEITGHKP